MKYIIPIIILVLVGGLIAGYAIFLLWAFSSIPVPFWVLGLVSVIFFALLVGLVVAFFSRLREMSKEDKNDYRNY